MALDPEIAARFAAIDSQIEALSDVINATTQAVADTQVELQKRRGNGFTQHFHVQIENLSHVPTWLGDAVWVSHGDLVTVATGSGRA
jgi:hypothetical protein